MQTTLYKHCTTWLCLHESYDKVCTKVVLLIGGVYYVVISLKDYAKQKGVSYEAVRRQVVRYKQELEGHIQKVNRTQFLDDEAVVFLDNKRHENPVVLVQADKDEELERLRNENKALLLKVTELQDALIQEKDNVKALQAEKIELLEMSRQQEQQDAAGKQRWWQRLFSGWL